MKNLIKSLIFSISTVVGLGLSEAQPLLHSVWTTNAAPYAPANDSSATAIGGGNIQASDAGTLYGYGAWGYAGGTAFGYGALAGTPLTPANSLNIAIGNLAWVYGGSPGAHTNAIEIGQGTATKDNALNIWGIPSFVKGAGNTLTLATNVTGVGSSANAVTAANLKSGQNGFSLIPSGFTNILVTSSFGLSPYNGTYYWSASLAYFADDGTPMTGGFTNSAGRYILNDPSSFIYAMSYTTDLSGFLVDYYFTLPESGYTNVLNTLADNGINLPTFQGTNNTAAGNIQFSINNSNSIIQLGGQFSGYVTATNGGTLFPTYLAQTTPKWMWNAYGSGGAAGQTAAVLTNHVQLFKAIGIDPYIDGYMLDSGLWVDRDASGNLYFNTNAWSALGGLYGAYRYIQTNTYNKTFIQWLPVAQLTNQTYVNVVSASDGCSIDSSSTSFGAYGLIRTFEDEINSIRSQALTYNKRYPLTSNFKQFSGIGWVPTQLNCDELFLDIPDDISSYTIFATAVHTCQPYTKYLRQGQYAKIPDVYFDSNTNKLQSILLMAQCALPLSGFWGSDSTTNALQTNGVVACITNADVRAIYKDPLLAKGVMVSSNGIGEVWVRKLSADRSVVVFWNPSDTSTNPSALTVNAADMGYAPNTSFNCKRIFLNTNSVFTGSLTMNYLAAGSSAGFLVEPVVKSVTGFSIPQLNNTNIALTAATTFTWVFTYPFANTNYSVGIAGMGNPLVSPQVGTKTTTNVVITFTAFTGTLNATAMSQ